MHMPSFNSQVKKNSIAFDIDFENLKQNIFPQKEEGDKSPKKVEVIPNVEDPNEEQKEQVLYKCPNCDRKFKREAYAKHVPICARVFTNNPPNNKNVENNKEKDKKNEKKGFNKKAKWENQSDELRAIIQQKRAEKAEDNNKKKEIKIEIEEDKRHSSNKIVITESNKKEEFTRDGIYYQCNLCNKKFTKINYESHLHDCKQKHKEKKNITFMNKPNMGLMNNPSSPTTRKPSLPAVTYGGYSKKPNFNLKFGKH